MKRSSLACRKRHQKARAAMGRRVRGGVRAFGPLPRVTSIAQPSTGYDDVRTIAAARLAVHSIDSIQVDWQLYGPKLAQVALTMGAGPVVLFFKVRLPHALPNIFAGLKMAMASASIGAIVGEFIASQQGLGYLVLVANGEMNTSLAFAGMLLLSLIGVALYFAVETIERLATGWHVSQRVGAVA